MSEQDNPAEYHVSRWPGWIWSVPIAAIGIAIWLGVRSVASAGPEVTVIFPEVSDIKSGDTQVKFQDLVVGQVDSVKLESDLRHIRVKLDLQPDLSGHLGKGTKFWISGGQPNLSNIASLRSIISGPSIAIDPAPGPEQPLYQGLADKPALPFGVQGSRFVLRADNLGSVQHRGTPVFYLGQKVGTVQDIRTVKGRSFAITTFIDKTYDQFVHAGTRFWSAGAITLDTGGTGPSLAFQSLPALLQGAIDFETPAGPQEGPVSQTGDTFTLYSDKDAALYAPGPGAVLYRVTFPAASGALAANAAVTLEGTRIGSVRTSRLLYDPASGTSGINVIIALDPTRIALAHGASWSNPRAQMDAMLNRLLSQGMRATLAASPPMVGGQTVALSFVDAQPGSLSNDPIPAIPTTGGGGIAGILATANDVVTKLNQLPLLQIASEVQATTHHLAMLASSPALGDTLHHLERTSLHMDHVTAAADHRIPPMLRQLQVTVNQITAALKSAQGILASGSSSLSGPEAEGLPDTLYEVTRAARSLRELTDFLDRHPEALIAGRGSSN